MKKINVQLHTSYMGVGACSSEKFGNYVAGLRSLSRGFEAKSTCLFSLTCIPVRNDCNSLAYDMFCYYRILVCKT